MGLRQAPDVSARRLAWHRLPSRLSTVRLGNRPAVRCPIPGRSQAGMPRWHQRIDQGKSLEGGRSRCTIGAVPEGNGARRQRCCDRPGVDPGKRRDAIFLRGPVGPRQAGRFISRAASAPISGRLRPIEHLRRDRGTRANRNIGLPFLGVRSVTPALSKSNSSTTGAIGATSSWTSTAGSGRGPDLDSMLTSIFRTWRGGRRSAKTPHARPPRVAPRPEWHGCMRAATSSRQ